MRKTTCNLRHPMGLRHRVLCAAIWRYRVHDLRHFVPQKSPISSGSFAKNDLQLKTSYGSSPSCTLYSHMAIWSARSSPFCTAQSTRWRRPIGCLKSQVIFRRRATNYRALLRKMMGLETIIGIQNRILNGRSPCFFSDEPVYMRPVTVI